MKVLAINGSPKKEGNTYRALKKVTDVLEAKGVEVQIVHIGNNIKGGCRGCNACFKKRDFKCIIEDDAVNECLELAKDADGLLFGSPVYFGGITGTMKCFMDRFFYTANGNKSFLRHKVAAGVIALRRSGGSAALDQLNKYLQYTELLLPTSNYWNITHGLTPGQVDEDAEGNQILELLGENFYWALQLVENAKGKVEEPELPRKVYCNFVR